MSPAPDPPQEDAARADSAQECVARQERARRHLKDADARLLLATPGVNFTWLTGASAHRMERLIAFLLPDEGPPAILCPAFEVENLGGRLPGAEVIAWGESDDPWRALGQWIRKRLGPAAGVALEPTTWFWMAERMRAASPDTRFVDGAAVFDALRAIKSPEEVARIRKAASVAEVAARHVRLHLQEGMTELEACENLLEVLRETGPPHEPLVQFGAQSAIPHADAGAARLKRGDMVLLDLGANVEGYLSDITRMTVFGDATREMKEIYRIVLEAQQAAIAAVRPGVPCQEVDRAARQVIAQAGYGEYFTHRTGHGIGMDIHESPWLVEGNLNPLAAGNVITVEPGIYLPGRFGVRIEDDVLVTATGAELLSEGAPSLMESF